MPNHGVTSPPGGGAEVGKNVFPVRLCDAMKDHGSILGTGRSSLLALSSLVYLLTMPVLRAQPIDLKLDHLTLEQGLSQSTVNAIVQDAQGFMWIGTQDGLNKFDGYSVTVFKHLPSDSNSIADNGIWSLMKDRQGDLWVGTMRGGLDRYLFREDRFVHYAHDPDNPASISENNVTSLFQDSRGIIWVGTLNNGLNRFNPASDRFVRIHHEAGNERTLSGNAVWGIAEDRKHNLWFATWGGLSVLPAAQAQDQDSSIDVQRSFVTFKHSSSNTASLPNDNVRTLHVDRSGVLWVGTWGGGLSRYDDSSRRFLTYRQDAGCPRGLSSNLVFSIHEDSRGNLWVGTGDAGINIYNRGSDDFTHFRSNVLNPRSLNNDIISALFEDQSGSMWIGTGAGGVNIFDWRKNRFVHYRDDQSDPGGLNGNDVWSILQDRFGELWIGTSGSGLNRFNRGRTSVVHYLNDASNPASIGHNNILALCEGDDGSVWVGTEGGGLSRFDRKTGEFVRFIREANDLNSISQDEVTALCQSSDRSLWIGTNGGGVDRLNLRSGIFTHYRPNEKDPRSLGGTSVMKIFEDRANVIWVGTWGGGLHRYEASRDEFVRYRPNPADANSLNSGTVLSIHEDSSGVLWLGTYGGGLNRFDPVAGQFSHFTEADGLPNDVIYGILPDDRGNLWLSTNKGISKFSPHTRRFKNYDVNDGLQGNEFNQGSYFRNKQGELFFGGINGFNAFSPDSITDNQLVPPVYITSFKVFDEPLRLAQSILATGRIQLSHAQNFFSFEFVALNFTSAEKNRYAYMLEGLDKNWILANARRYASYTNLDPGEYLLKVKGSNNDGVWNEQGVTLAITISPPYWRTWWFRIGTAAMLVCVMFLMYRYRVNKLLEIERIRSSIATDLHDDIGSTLTEIALYSDVGLRELRGKSASTKSADGEMPKVESLLQDIGETARGLIDAMNDIVWSIDPKNDSFEFLLLRMKGHAVKVLEAKGINYEIDIPADLSRLTLPLGFRRRFFLIFKEAINNIVRHAHASKVVLTMRKENSSLTMTIADNGVGFDKNSVQQGNGLRNMQERAASLQGVLHIDARNEEGTTITLTAPIP